jgi:hypothetical protein
MHTHTHTHMHTQSKRVPSARPPAGRIHLVFEGKPGAAATVQRHERWFWGRVVFAPGVIQGLAE